MEFFDLTSFFDLPYIIAVVLAPEFLKVYIPQAGTVRKTLLTLLLAIFLGGMFMGFNFIGTASEPFDLYAKKLLVSFLFATSFYSLVFKFVMALIKNFKDKNLPDEPAA